MNIALILSGGIGSRMKSDIPKQYLIVEDRPVIGYCIEKFAKNDAIDKLIIVAANEWIPLINNSIEAINIDKEILYASPGITRQLSIKNGLDRISELFNVSDYDKVIVHDAARPLVSNRLINDCLNSCDRDFLGVLPVINVKDTIYYSKDGIHIDSLLNRNELFAGQAPEAFNLKAYIKAHTSVSYEELLSINGSTELAYKVGMKIKLVPGDYMNFKITDMTDLANFKNICHESKRTV